MLANKEINTRSEYRKGSISHLAVILIFAGFAGNIVDPFLGAGMIFIGIAILIFVTIPKIIAYVVDHLLDKNKNN